MENLKDKAWKESKNNFQSFLVENQEKIEFDKDDNLPFDQLFELFKQELKKLDEVLNDRVKAEIAASKTDPETIKIAKIRLALKNIHKEADSLLKEAGSLLIDDKNNVGPDNRTICEGIFLAIVAARYTNQYYDKGSMVNTQDPSMGEEAKQALREKMRVTSQKVTKYASKSAPGNHLGRLRNFLEMLSVLAAFITCGAAMPLLPVSALPALGLFAASVGFGLAGGLGFLVSCYAPKISIAKEADTLGKELKLPEPVRGPAQRK